MDQKERFRHCTLSVLFLSALKFHILSKQHKERTPSFSNIVSLLTPYQDQSDQKGKDSNEPASKETTSNEQAKKKQSSVDLFSVKSATISAEICWVLNLVTSKYSVNSSSNYGDLFSVICPDSDNAKRFEMMLSKTSDCPYISLSFDESSNSSVQNGYHHSILGLGDKLCCHTLPRIGLYGQIYS